MDNAFGKHLRELRESRSPKITQEVLAASVGKTKMTISLIEQGKNDPPQGDFLQKIVEVLKLNNEEKSKLFDLAAAKRKTVPEDILDYFHTHPQLINAIRRAKKKNMPDSVWAEVIKE